MKGNFSRFLELVATASVLPYCHVLVIADIVRRGASTASSPMPDHYDDFVSNSAVYHRLSRLRYGDDARRDFQR